MRIAYFGSSAFSVPPLRSISAMVVCVVTKQAKPRGRGYLLEDNEVKKAATELGLPVLEINSFRDEAAAGLRDVNADLFVVASFGLIIPKWALEIPALGSVNIHPSLLPRYRGPSPIQWAILMGDRETGITLMRMNERMDEGNILRQEKARIEESDTAETLSGRLSARSAEMLAGLLREVEQAGLSQGEVQKGEEATYTPIITKEMGRIDWARTAREIGCQVRAFHPWPTAYTFLGDLMFKVFSANLEEGPVDGPPGTIRMAGKMGVVVECGKDRLVLQEVQLENKKRMGASEFARGYRGLEGRVLGSL